jgi:hypothetical protein
LEQSINTRFDELNDKLNTKLDEFSNKIMILVEKVESVLHSPMTYTTIPQLSILQCQENTLRLNNVLSNPCYKHGNPTTKEIAQQSSKIRIQLNGCERHLKAYKQPSAMNKEQEELLKAVNFPCHHSTSTNSLSEKKVKSSSTKHEPTAATTTAEIGTQNDVETTLIRMQKNDTSSTKKKLGRPLRKKNLEIIPIQPQLHLLDPQLKRRIQLLQRLPNQGP